MLTPRKREDIENDGRENSAILSDRVRVTSLAIIGLSWSFIIANLTSNALRGAGLIRTESLLVPVLLSVVALFVDFVQYIFNQLSIDIILNSSKTLSSDIGIAFKRLARLAFLTKIIIAFLATLKLMFVIGAVMQ